MNMKRLRATFHEFAGLVERPESSIHWGPYGVSFQLSRERMVESAADNIVHVRRLSYLIFDLHNLAQTTDSSGREVRWTKIVNRKLRRLYCLLAIMYGNTREPSLWLSTMDWMLEDLAKWIVGHADPMLETVRMQRFQQIVSSKGAALQLPSRADKAVIAQLERHHLARELFSELALFYRGAIILLFCAVSTSSSRSTERTRLEGTKTWYEELLKWSNKCGHPHCFEAVETEYTEDASRNKFGLSVGVIDPRVGSVQTR